MASRRERDGADVARYLPRNTRLLSVNGRDVWVFKKNTELGVVFEIGIYFDPDEDGYCAQVISPEIEASWKNAHVGHIFSDAVICMGYGGNPKTRPTLRASYAKSCLWAEGMAAMIQGLRHGRKIPFPFSINNSENDLEA